MVTWRVPDWTVLPLSQAKNPRVFWGKRSSSIEVSASKASAIADPASTRRVGPVVPARATRRTSPAAASPPTKATSPFA